MICSEGRWDNLTRRASLARPTRVAALGAWQQCLCTAAFRDNTTAPPRPAARPCSAEAFLLTSSALRTLLWSPTPRLSPVPRSRLLCAHKQRGAPPRDQLFSTSARLRPTPPLAKRREEHRNLQDGKLPKDGEDWGGYVDITWPHAGPRYVGNAKADMERQARTELCTRRAT